MLTDTPNVREKKRPKAKRQTAKVQMLIDIGGKLRTLRESGGPGRTQEWLAKQARVSRNIVSNIETGKNYTSKNLVKIMAALTADLDTVLNINEIVEDQREIYRKLNELLHANGRFPSSVRTNIEDLYQVYKLDSGASAPANGRKVPRSNR